MSQPFNLTMKVLSPAGEQTVTIAVSSVTQVSAIRASLSQQINQEPNHIRFIFRGRPLLNEQETLGVILGENTSTVMHAVVTVPTAPSATPPPRRNAPRNASNRQSQPETPRTTVMRGFMEAFFQSVGEAVVEAGIMNMMGQHSATPHTEEDLMNDLASIVANLRDSRQFMEDASVSVEGNRYRLPDHDECPNEPSDSVRAQIHVGGPTTLTRAARVLELYSEQLVALADKTREFAAKMRQEEGLISVSNTSNVPMNVPPLPCLTNPSDAIRQDGVLWLEAHGYVQSAGRGWEHLISRITGTNRDNVNSHHYASDDGEDGEFPFPFPIPQPVAVNRLQATQRPPRSTSSPRPSSSQSQRASSSTQNQRNNSSASTESRKRRRRDVE